MGYKAELVAPPQIEQAILLIRGQRVMLDRDLAAMYGVSTGNLQQGGAPQPVPFSRRFHVPTHGG